MNLIYHQTCISLTMSWFATFSNISKFLLIYCYDGQPIMQSFNVSTKRWCVSLALLSNISIILSNSQVCTSSLISKVLSIFSSSFSNFSSILILILPNEFHLTLVSFHVFQLYFSSFVFLFSFKKLSIHFSFMFDLNSQIKVIPK